MASGGTWTSNAGGTFNPNTTTPNATWTPPSAYSGAAILTFTSSGSGACAGFTATVGITVNPLPTASAGGSQSICATGTATVSGASAANNSSVNWTSNGHGTISNPATLTPTYNAVAADAGTTVTLTMTAYGTSGACSSATASATYTVVVYPNMNVTSVTGTSPICIGSGNSVTYTANGVVLGGAGSGLWSSSNGAIASVPGSSTGTTVTVTGVTAGTCFIAYTVSGGCGIQSAAQQNITVTPSDILTLSSGATTNAQNTGIDGPISTITYTTTGATGVTVTGLPPGVTYSWSSPTLTISGTPNNGDANNNYTYTVSESGGCNPTSTTGYIDVTLNPCINPNNWGGTYGSGCGAEGAIAPTCLTGQTVALSSTQAIYTSLMGGRTYSFSVNNPGTGGNGVAWQTPYISVFQSSNDGGNWTYVGGAANSYNFTTGTSAGPNAPSSAGSSWYYLVEVESGNTCGPDWSTYPNNSATLTYQEDGTSVPGLSSGTPGSGSWTAYGYNGTDPVNLSNDTYLGYYTSTGNTTFSTLAEWNNVGSPSWVQNQTISSPYSATISAWTGCNVNNNTQVTQHIRQGFTCGIYQLDMADPANEADGLSLDDNGALYLNGNQIWGQVGCCVAGGWQNLASGNSGSNIGAQYVCIGTNGIVDFRNQDGCGGSEGNLVFTSKTYPALAGGTVSPSLTTDWYRWGKPG